MASSRYGQEPHVDDILRTAQGIVAENVSRSVPVSVGALVTGTTYFMGLPLRAGTLVSNITIVVTTAGAAVTVSKVGLFSKAGVLLAVSADQGTNWHSLGNKTIAMVTPYTVPVSDMYYVALLAVFTSTAPQVLRSTNSAIATQFGVPIGSGSLLFGVQLSQSNMPSPATIVQGSSTAINCWAAIT